jgi:hypothetical protein
LAHPSTSRKSPRPAYFLSTREDHIAPWRATYAGIKLLGSKNISFTLAASGHIAGIVNAPAKNKYCYWTSPKPAHPTATGWTPLPRTKAPGGLTGRNGSPPTHVKKLPPQGRQGHRTRPRQLREEKIQLKNSQ